MGSRLVQFIWFSVFVAAVVVCGTLQGPLDDRCEKYEIASPESAVAQRHPELILLSVAPGGLRAPVVNYLWIRAQDLRDKGRNFDAMQLASMICRLQPRFAGVWDFHAWNMAWNISVATHTPEERWLWVSNGMKLLRDEGIPLNPDALQLYKQLGWIFFNKMGQTLDDMHMVYKQRWASEMQHLLGAPPYAPAKEVIDAFRPIAEAPLDRDLRRQGREDIQPDKLDALLKQPGMAKYVSLLADQRINVDDSFLDAYDRFSRDDAVDCVRVEPPKLLTDHDKAVSAVINDPKYSAERAKLLAFVRAQLLWNRYRMDPDWMLQLMQRYGPLDWRQVWPHGLYWITVGVHRTQSLALADIDAINTDRIAMNCLKELTWAGRMTYIENPRQPEAPLLNFASDPRFIDPCQQEHERTIEAVIKTNKETFDNNIFKSGHVNYLEQAIQLLVAARRIDEARKYYDYLKTKYGMAGGAYDSPTPEGFALAQMNADGIPIPSLAIGQISASLEASFVSLSQGRREDYRKGVDYVKRVYDLYQKTTAERNRFRPLPEIASAVLGELLVEPRMSGYNMSLMARSRLYNGVPVEMQVAVYDALERYVRPACEAEGLDFAKAFPAPPGLEAYRKSKAAKVVAPQ